VAERDLGGLGSTAGEPVVVHWPIWRLPLQVLPWVLLVGLVFLPFNRGTGAGWIVVGWLVSLLCMRLGLAVLGGVMGGAAEEFVEILGVVSYAFAAGWLISPRTHAWSSGWRWLAVGLVFGVAGQAARLALGFSDEEGGYRLAAALLLGMIWVAGGLGALCCRGSRRLGLLFSWALIWIWLVGVSLALVLSLVEGGGVSDMAQLLGAVTVVVGLVCSALLPYGVLALAHAGLRRRSVAWVWGEGVPPVARSG
jgi:hypothetical protein